MEIKGFCEMVQVVTNINKSHLVMSILVVLLWFFLHCFGTGLIIPILVNRYVLYTETAGEGYSHVKAYRDLPPK